MSREVQKLCTPSQNQGEKFSFSRLRTKHAYYDETKKVGSLCRDKKGVSVILSCHNDDDQHFFASLV